VSCRGGFRHRQHRLLPRASHKHVLVHTTGITVGRGGILILPWLEPVLHDTCSCTRSRILAGIMVRKYRVIRAYRNLYKKGLASPRLPRASHNLKPPLVSCSIQKFGTRPRAQRVCLPFQTLLHRAPPSLSSREANTRNTWCSHVTSFWEQSLPRWIARTSLKQTTTTLQLRNNI
jgi:hypothetical protein